MEQAVRTSGTAVRARKRTGTGSARAGPLAVSRLGRGAGGCAGAIDDKAQPVDISLTVPLPPAAPRTTGVDSPAAREHKQLVAYFGGEYHAPAIERFVDEVLVKLAAASDTPSQVYRVTILNSPIVNAFALPSGEIFVTRGLLALANDTSEVAAVMAHEIAHVTERHALRRAEIEKTSAVITKAAAVIDDQNRQKNFQNYAQLTLASFSRQQEIDADQVGIRVIAKAGLRPFRGLALSGVARPRHRPAPVAPSGRAGEARPDGDPSLDARARRPCGGGGAGHRGAGHRRDRPRQLPRRHRRHPLRRRSRAGLRARPALHPPEARLRLHGARGFRPRELRPGGARRDAGRQPGAAARQHEGLVRDEPRSPIWPPAGSRGCRPRERRSPSRSTA